MNRHLLITCLLLGGLNLVTGCATSYPRLTEPNAAYLAALQSTTPSEPRNVDLEKAGMARLMKLFQNYRADYLQAHVGEVYADELFFRDGFREIHNVRELTDYIVHSTEPLRSCTFEFGEPVESNGNYFLQWTMKVSLKRDKEEHEDVVLGMSHLRFNQEGKVVFHQDYWDPTDMLYRRIPVANWLIGVVRSKL